MLLDQYFWKRYSTKKKIKRHKSVFIIYNDMKFEIISHSKNTFNQYKSHENQMKNT